MCCLSKASSHFVVFVCVNPDRKPSRKMKRRYENVSKDKHIFYKNNHFVNNYLFFHPVFYYQSTTKLSHYIKISTFSSHNYKKSSISLAKRARNVQKTPFYFSALSIILFTFVGYFT